MSGPWKTSRLGNGRSRLSKEPPAQLAPELRRGGSQGAYRIPPSERQAAPCLGRGGEEAGGTALDCSRFRRAVPGLCSASFFGLPESTCRTRGSQSSHSRVLPREGAPGEVGASRSLSRAGAGAEPNCRWGPPQGRGSGPTLRGVSLAVPPAPPAASAAARRSSAAFPAQSVSRRRWVSGGRSGRGRGCGEGSPGVRIPRPGLPSPLLPVLVGFVSPVALPALGCP